MLITEDLVLKLEQLTRLELSAGEREHLLQDLNKILGMVDKLNGLDTQGVEPLVYLNEEPLVLRPDVPEGQVEREAALRNAPEADGVYFRTPKVIEG